MYKKYLLVILILQTCFSVVGQESKLFGRWITPECDFILIKKPKNEVILADFSVLNEYKQGWTKTRYDLTLRYHSCSNDTLRFYRILYNYPDIWETENYDFEIIAHNDTSITLVPITFFSKRLFPNKDTLDFIRQKYAITKIQFQKLDFYTSRNLKNILQIDSVGNMYMQKEILIDESYVTQYFKGKLKRSLFEKLINMLQTCNLETLDWGSQGYSDTFEKVLTINYDNKNKRLKSGKPSPISQPLIEFLMNIEKQVKLKETKDKISLD